MKPQYFIAILFGTSLYWMYLLYSPFLLAMMIAGLLAISTANIQVLFEKIFRSEFKGAIASTLLLALLFFAPLGYFLTTLTIKLNSLDPDIFLDIEAYVRNFIDNPPNFLLFLKPYAADFLKKINLNDMTTNILSFKIVVIFSCDSADISN